MNTLLSFRKCHQHTQNIIYYCAYSQIRGYILEALYRQKAKGRENECCTLLSPSFHVYRYPKWHCCRKCDQS